jgi:predicted nucleic acid-binding protein
MKFRKKNKKRNLSYADCIGYIYALKNNLIFLTGDKEFEDLKNVEFVK